LIKKDFTQEELKILFKKDKIPYNSWAEGAPDKGREVRAGGH
jgi:hypothetical protein